MLFIYNKLKPVILTTFVLLNVYGCAQKKLVLNIDYIQPYCGGARPTPEMEKDAQTPKPYTTRMIYIVSQKGKVDSVKTNESGIINIELKPGVYNCFESWRYNKQTPDLSSIDRFNKDCLKTEWKKEFMTITVSKTKVKTQKTNQIINYCDYNLPCLKESAKPPMRE